MGNDQQMFYVALLEIEAEICAAEGCWWKKEYPFHSLLLYSLDGIWIGSKVGEEFLCVVFPVVDTLRTCWALSPFDVSCVIFTSIWWDRYQYHLFLYSWGQWGTERVEIWAIDPGLSPADLLPTPATVGRMFVGFLNWCVEQCQGHKIHPISLFDEWICG